MKGKLCVDLSEYQKGISFSALKAEGVKGVILRGGDGSYEDNCFRDFYDQAKAQGLPVGAYWYSRAVTGAQARAEAERFHRACLKGRKFELPIYLDVECDAQGSLGRDGLTAVILAWSQYLRQRGYLCGVYTWPSWFRDRVHLEKIGHLERWVCQWSGDRPEISHGMWQFGGETNFLRSNTIAGYVVDQNDMVTDYPAMVKKYGKNGYKEEKKMYKFYEDVPGWAQSAVKAAMDKGVLKGTGVENGKPVLDLSEDLVRMLVILQNMKLL